jgi:hypothetical protein
MRAVPLQARGSTRSTGSGTATARRCCSAVSGAATSTSTTSARFDGALRRGLAGIDPLRRVYDLGTRFATFALRAGISTFDLSRYMGPA